MPIILNFMFILASRIVHQILHQNCDIEMICSYGQKFIPLNWLLRKLLLRSRASKYVAEFSRSSSSIASFILSNSVCSLLLLFLAIVRNFIFWPCVVILNLLSLSSDKGIISFYQDVQYQSVLFFWIYIYIFSILNIFLNVWIFILLHFVCTHSWHLPHCTALSFFATGLLQILQGYFIGIFMSSYSYSNFDVLLLL